MSDKLSVLKELEAIKLALQACPYGALIEDIESKIEIDIPRRTLQRRLQKLKKIGQLDTDGKTKAAKYYLIGHSETKEPIVIQDDLIPLSIEGKKILNLISLPIQKRNPVGYNIDFIKSYKPNVTAYLTSIDIKGLEKLGKTTMPEEPAGTYLKGILNRLLIDLSWNSSRLEGNTYSLLDTQRLISSGQEADDKSTIEAQMILNHKDAIEFLVQSSDEIGFNRYTILNLHAMLSNNLLPDPAASGRLRHISVGISHSVYEPLAIPQIISEVFDLTLEKIEEIKDPFEQAFFAMVHFPYLQPFDDVNKRVSRLASNIPFAKHNLSPLSFIDVPNDIYISGMLGVYELNRIDLLKDVFIWAYSRSSAKYAAIRQSLGESDPFRLKYRNIIHNLISAIISEKIIQKEAILRINTQAKDLPWEDQGKFIESVESELLSLHEGNFARYQVTPSEFERWKKAWL